jgi:excinuclease UvrABC nuclease subunit
VSIAAAGRASGAWIMIEQRLERHRSLLLELLSQPVLPYSRVTPSSVPYQPGVYRIFRETAEGAAEIYIGESTNLSDRIYQHLMGNRQASTLKNKLMARAGFQSEDSVKDHLRNECHVQFLVIEDHHERISLEHFAIAILAPEFND